MNWNLVALDAVRPSPWRNGGGLTCALAQWPPQGDWLWRMSVATVDKSGPFSVFEGVDRWFAVLDGAGVKLRVADREHTLGPDSPPFFFEGATPTDCELLDGSTQDFNLMVRQGCGPSTLQRIRQATEMKVQAGKTVAVYANKAAAALQGAGQAVQIAPHTLAWNTLTEALVIRVESTDALWMEIPA